MDLVHVHTTRVAEASPPPTDPTTEPRSERVRPRSVLGTAHRKTRTANWWRKTRFLVFAVRFWQFVEESRAGISEVAHPKARNRALGEMAATSLLFFFFFDFFFSNLALWVGPRAFLGLERGDKAQSLPLLPHCFIFELEWRA